MYVKLFFKTSSTTPLNPDLQVALDTIWVGWGGGKCLPKLNYSSLFFCFFLDHTQQLLEVNPGSGLRIYSFWLKELYEILGTESNSTVYKENTLHTVLLPNPSSLFL